jgi:hypothetical protein
MWSITRYVLSLRIARMLMRGCKIPKSRVRASTEVDFVLWAVGNCPTQNRPTPLTRPHARQQLGLLGPPRPLGLSVCRSTLLRRAEANCGVRTATLTERKFDHFGLGMSAA